MTRWSTAALVGLLAAIAGAQDPPQDPAAEYKARAEQAKKSSAAKHVSVGEYLASQGMHGWARDEYNKAIADDADNEAARKKLGDRKKEDGSGWEGDPNATVKTSNDPKKKDEEKVKIKTEYEKRLTDLGKSMGAEWYKIGTLAEKANLKDEATAAYKMAIEFDPSQGDARKKLGYEKTKEGGWISAADKKLYEVLVQGIAKAPGGAEDKGASEAGGKIGLSMARRTSEHFTIEAPHLDQKQLTVLCQHAEHAYDMFHKLFNQSKLLPDKYTIVILKDKSQHEKYVDAFYTGDATRKEFTRNKCAGMGGYPKSECFQGDHPDVANMDYCIHYPVQAMVTAVAGGNALWMEEGVALWFTARMKQTATWACVDLAGTGTGGNNKNYQDPKNWGFVIKTWLKEAKDPDINAVIKVRSWADLDGARTLKAWSIVDFLIAEHKEKFIQFMQDMKSAKDTGETSLKNVWGWDLPDLDTKWKAWARVTYQ